MTLEVQYLRTFVLRRAFLCEAPCARWGHQLKADYVGRHRDATPGPGDASLLS